jgi:hypothetical protein
MEKRTLSGPLFYFAATRFGAFCRVLLKAALSRNATGLEDTAA